MPAAENAQEMFARPCGVNSPIFAGAARATASYSAGAEIHADEKAQVMFERACGVKSPIFAGAARATAS